MKSLLQDQDSKVIRMNTLVVSDIIQQYSYELKFKINVQETEKQDLMYYNVFLPVNMLLFAVVLALVLFLYLNTNFLINH